MIKIRIYLPRARNLIACGRDNFLMERDMWRRSLNSTSITWVLCPWGEMGRSQVQRRKITSKYNNSLLRIVLRMRTCHWNTDQRKKCMHIYSPSHCRDQCSGDSGLWYRELFKSTPDVDMRCPRAMAKFTPQECVGKNDRQTRRTSTTLFRARGGTWTGAHGRTCTGAHRIMCMD